jgi:phosphinothricin acetyltransferase
VAEDWPAVAAIYGAGIEERAATFETAVPTWSAWDAARLPWGRLVATGDEAVLGFVAASPTSSRSVYAGVVEHSVYVTPTARGRGVGAALLHAFVATAREHGVWTVQAGLFPENAASIALHERAGFRLVGRRERIARLDGVWRDTLLYELRLADV